MSAISLLRQVLVLLLLLNVAVECSGGEEGERDGTLPAPRLFETISEKELIAHELANPFTPYYRDPKYRGSRSKFGSSIYFRSVDFYRILLCLIETGLDGNRWSWLWILGCWTFRSTLTAHQSPSHYANTRGGAGV